VSRGGAHAHALRLRHAIALGLLQGPTELLPVSSSAHTTLVPFLAGWSHDELDPTLRKSFEVALHAGTAAALLTRRPYPQGEPRPALSALVAAVAPPALAGYALGSRIERRLGTPSTIAAGLLGGSVALAGGELAARARGAGRHDSTEDDGIGAPARQTPVAAGERRADEAGLRDGLAVGIAQALALIPGVSRSGAALAAARARGFSRLDADRLSWQAGMLVLAGAALLQSLRLARSQPSARTMATLAAGGLSAFASTRWSVAMLTPGRRSRALIACAGYRGALAALVIRRLRMAAASNALPIPTKETLT